MYVCDYVKTVSREACCIIVLFRAKHLQNYLYLSFCLCAEFWTQRLHLHTINFINNPHLHDKVYAIKCNFSELFLLLGLTILIRCMLEICEGMRM